MGYCTGSGEANGDHCCYVEGQPCPHLMDNAAIVAWINAQGWGATKTNAALAFAQNIQWTCRIGLKILANVTAARSNRARYEQEFAADPEYQAWPAPAWQAKYANGGVPVGSLECYAWQGDPPGQSCCFRRSTAECDAEAASRGITSQALTVRRAGGRAD